MPMSRRSRAGDRSGAASAVVAVFLALGLAACAGPGGSSGPAPAHAPGQTVSAGSLFGDMVTRIEARHSVHFTSTSTDSAGEGDIVFAGSDSRMAYHGAQGGQQTSMRVFPDAIYLADSSQPGRSWLRLSATGTDVMSKLMAPVVTVITTSVNPANQVKLFAAARPFTTVGSERIGDTTTTHYRGTVPASAMLGLLPQETRDLVRGRLSGEIAVDAWIDADGLPVKIQTARPGAQPAVTSYSHWGQDVDVVRPPDNQVADPPRMPGAPSTPPNSGG
jgi:hypothetical protein